MKTKIMQSYRLSMTLLGLVLSLGAPLGYFLYSYLLQATHSSMAEWALFIFQNKAALLLYLTLPTMFVFGAFGYVSGHLLNGLQKQRDQMDEFLHIAAHDIRSPLSVLMGVVSLMNHKDKSKMKFSPEKLSQMLLKQVTSMKVLLDEMLDIHKMEAGGYELEIKPTMLLDVISQVIDEMFMQIESKHIKFEIKYELESDFVLHVDPFRIRQVLRNILANALKFMPEEESLDLKVYREESWIHIRIFNSGTQIDPQQIKNVFDKFIQAKNRQSKLGTGIGLAICKHIVELHKGQIWAENINEEGVAFHIRLRLDLA